MPLHDQQNFLAKLLTDDGLRASFLQNPDDTGRKEGMAEGDLATLKAINPDDLDFFAVSLVNKRLGEVEKLLPFSLQAIGKKKFREMFKEFSDGYVPEGIKKHLEDALEFGRLLQRHKDGRDWQRDAIKFDTANLLFYSGRKNLLIRVLRYDLAFGERRLRKHPFRKLQVALWIRFGAWARHFVW